LSSDWVTFVYPSVPESSLPINSDGDVAGSGDSSRATMRLGHLPQIQAFDAEESPSTTLASASSNKPVTVHKLFRTKYFAHIDLAKTHDACGIAIYVSGGVKILRGIAKDQHYEVCPEIRTALLPRVVAPPNGEILAPRSARSFL
jgi:hypothetical protein